MMVNKGEEILIYESPDGGKSIYVRKIGESERQLIKVDDSKFSYNRWVRLKDAVMLDDPSINDLIEKIEILYALKKKEIGN